MSYLRDFYTSRRFPIAGSIFIIIAIFAASFSGHGLIFEKAGAANDPELTVGSISAAPGANIEIPIMFSVGITGVRTMNFNISLPTNIVYVSIAAGSAATAAGKNVQANVVGTSLRVLVFGINREVIGSGTLAIVTLKVASAAAPGAYQLAPSGIVATDVNGANVTVSPKPGTLTVTSGTKIKPNGKPSARPAFN